MQARSVTDRFIDDGFQAMSGIGTDNQVHKKQNKHKIYKNTQKKQTLTNVHYSKSRKKTQNLTVICMHTSLLTAVVSVSYSIQH